jgi:hypothetical protein
MNWVDIIKALVSLDPETRSKVITIIEDIVELLKDPAFRAFLEKFAPKA